MKPAALNILHGPSERQLGVEGLATPLPSEQKPSLIVWALSQPVVPNSPVGQQSDLESASDPPFYTSPIRCSLKNSTWQDECREMRRFLHHLSPHHPPSVVVLFCADIPQSNTRTQVCHLLLR